VIIILDRWCNCGKNFTKTDRYFNNSLFSWIDRSEIPRQSFFDDTFELTLDDFPDTVFKFTYGMNLFVSDENGLRHLFSGMPISNIFVTDITGDGLPDFVANASWGSGIVHDYVIVYDIANDRKYELSARFHYHYRVQMRGDALIVQQLEHNGERTVLREGTLAIEDGELTVREALSHLSRK
jgi:hypothetical protein